MSGARLKMGKVQPDAYRALDALDQYCKNAKLDNLQKEMIKILTS